MPLDRLSATIAGFERLDPDVAYWKVMPEVEEPVGTGDCVALSRRFSEFCHARGLWAAVVELHPGSHAPDPLQGWHRITWVEVSGRLWGVDWTARQLHDVGEGVDPQGIACPPVWSDPQRGYPSIGQACFDGPIIIGPSDLPD